jgi:hypothetical protein
MLLKGDLDPLGSYEVSIPILSLGWQIFLSAPLKGKGKAIVLTPE